jgi:hypothetical protein
LHGDFGAAYFEEAPPEHAAILEKRNMGKHLVGLATVGALMTAASLQAQATLGPTLAWENDLDLGVGATLRAPLPSVGEGVGVMADLLIFFPNLSDYFEINANVTYDLPLQESTSMPFVLAGLTLGRSSAEMMGVSFSDTAVRLNIGGGVEFGAGKLRPTAGLRIELGDGDALILFASIPFALGNQPPS